MGAWGAPEPSAIGVSLLFLSSDEVSHKKGGERLVGRNSADADLIRDFHCPPMTLAVIYSAQAENFLDGMGAWMRKSEILITGANGEIGQSLIRFLAEDDAFDIIALDLTEPSPELVALCKAFYRGNILDRALISEIEVKHQFEQIFHLAGLLSSTAEKNPKLAHQVNVDGSLNIFDVAHNHSNRLGKPVVFAFSSSIAVYGLQPGDDRSCAVHERQFLTPTTMYGINKLYIEQLGRYYSRYYKNVDNPSFVRLDFRCLRFPGLISHKTLPMGGTTDYASEMLHSAARGLPYQCFVEPDTRLPFMVMSDAIRALVLLVRAEPADLRRRIYNVTSYSVNAAEIKKEILKHFPAARIGFDPNPLRQGIVDGWPGIVDDRPAREDWGWEPEYGFSDGFAMVLVPNIKARYRVAP